MTIGIVIPTYNRIDNLKVVLTSIQKQSYNDYYVVVADDGSTDGTREYIENLSRSDRWYGRIKWVGCGKNVYMRAGRTKNIGIANLPENIKVFLSLDSDVILSRDCLLNYSKIYKEKPSTIIFGTVDWLPPELNPRRILELIKKTNYNLDLFVPDGLPERKDGTFVGKEIRLFADFTSGQDTVVTAKWALFLNTLIPRNIFTSLNGYDEDMKGYGYNDMEFGMQLERCDVKCLYSMTSKGYHIWHKKDLSRAEENQRNLDYFLRKYGYDGYYYENIDWRYWWHYSYWRGAILISAGKEIFAVNNVRTDYIKLTSLSWIKKLGFVADEIETRTKLYFKDMNFHGNVFETDVDDMY